MPSFEIEEFGTILVREVRDTAVGDCDNFLNPISGADVSRRWREAGVPKEVLDFMIPDAVDMAISCLLQAIDQGVLHLKFVSSNGKEVDLVNEGFGELEGWFNGEWLARFAKERFVDDLADLRK